MELHRLSTCVAAEAAQLLQHVTDMQHPLGWALVVDLAATLATWLVSVAINNSEAKRNAAETAQKHFTCPAPSGSAYDPYWSVMPPIMALYLAWIGSAASSELSLSLRQAAVLVGVLVWAGRLTFNWWGRVAKHWLAGNTAEEDWRYLDFKRQWGGGVIYWLVFSLGGFHLFPTLLTYIGCLPLWYALAAPSAHAAWGAWDTLGALCLVACIGLETVADAHMDRFLASPKTPPVCDSGLWGLSRHPNYLGEILLWVGLAAFALGAAGPCAAASSVGAVLMLALFVGVSIPLMEARQLRRRGDAYAAYMRRVPMLCPTPQSCLSVYRGDVGSASAKQE